MGFKVMQIEVSNHCSLACSYCPHPSQVRHKGLMERSTFEKCIELVRRSENFEIDGRKFVYLNHFGEPLLNPNLPEFIRYASSKNIEVSFSTNGVDNDKKLFSRDIWRGLADAGLRGVIVSCHVKSEATLRRHFGDLVKIYSVFKPKRKWLHNWAGQVEIKKLNNNFLLIPDYPCDYETHNMFAITWEGKIAACCYDIEGRVLLTVDDILNGGFSFRKISLCEKCGLGRGDVAWLSDEFAQLAANGTGRQPSRP